VLEREPHAKVRRQAKRRNQLGGADSVTGRWLGCHNATLPSPIGHRERRRQGRPSVRIRAGAGAATEKPGLQRPSRKMACPACVLSKAPS
jgi:hypothetical protein